MDLADSVSQYEPLQVSLAGIDPETVRAVVTTRFGGVSQGRFASLNVALHVGDDDDAVLLNRLRAATNFGASLNDFIFANQVGGTSVTRVGSSDRGRGTRSLGTAIPATDALVTTDPGVVLAVLAADCMLIALHDPQAHVLGVVHAGWPGTTAGIIPRAVDAMRDCGADPERIIASISPAVDGDRYQVGEDVADAALVALGSRVTTALRADGTGRYLFDLPAAARVHLARAGVPDGHVFTSDQVTGPGTPFYSHRFEGPTGRFALFAQLAPKGTTR